MEHQDGVGRGSRRGLSLNRELPCFQASVLNSKRAIQVDIEIMRAFVKFREMISSHKDLTELEKKYDGQYQIVFEAIRQLIEVEEKPKSKIGFIARERQAGYWTSRKR